MRWRRYIDWVVDTFPAGGEASGLREVLHRCTQAFVSDERYRNDPRYIRIWIRYVSAMLRMCGWADRVGAQADSLPDPADVFSFMRKHRIGEGVALFWMAFALVAEQSRKYHLASQCYHTGIARRAEPVVDLKNRQRQFYRRIARKAQEFLGTDNTTTGAHVDLEALERAEKAALHPTGDPAAPPVSRGNKRGALSQISTEAAARTVRAGESSAQGGIAVAVRAARGGSNARPVVFDDGETTSERHLPKDSAAAAVMAMSPSRLPGGVKSSAILPFEDDLRKENSQRPVVWSEQGGLPVHSGTENRLEAATTAAQAHSTMLRGEKLRQQRLRRAGVPKTESTDAPPPSVFSVFEEEHLDSAPVSKPAVGSALQQRDLTEGAESLVRRPTQAVRPPVTWQVIKQRGGDSVPPPSREKMGSDSQLHEFLYGGGLSGSSWSAEELRALRWAQSLPTARLHSLVRPFTVADDDSSSMELSDDEEQDQPKSSPAPQSTVRGRPPTHGFSSVKKQEKRGWQQRRATLSAMTPSRIDDVFGEFEEEPAKETRTANLSALMRVFGDDTEGHTAGVPPPRRDSLFPESQGEESSFASGGASDVIDEDVEKLVAQASVVIEDEPTPRTIEKGKPAPARMGLLEQLSPASAMGSTAKPPVAVDDVTINTRLAMADLEAMLSSPAPAVAASSVPVAASLSFQVFEEEEPLAKERKQGGVSNPLRQIVSPALSPILQPNRSRRKASPRRAELPAGETLDTSVTLRSRKQPAGMLAAPSFSVFSESSPTFADENAADRLLPPRPSQAGSRTPFHPQTIESTLAPRDVPFGDFLAAAQTGSSVDVGQAFVVFADALSPSQARQAALSAARSTAL
jgi:hypothetical protein